MRGLDRYLAYSAAVLCGVLLWLGVASPAGDWRKPVGLLVGGVGLVVLALVILRLRWQGR